MPQTSTTEGTYPLGVPLLSTRKLFEAAGRPIWLVGVGVGLSGVLAFGAQELVLGRLRLAAVEPGVASDLGVAITHIAITAYLLTAWVYAQRTTEESLGALMPLVDPRRVEGLLTLSRGQRSALAGSFFAGLAAYVFVNTRISPGDVSLVPSSWTPEVAWHRVLGLAMAVLTARLFTLLVIESGRLSTLAGAIRELDLLAPEALAPFARQGLVSALLVIGVASAFALFLVDLRYLPLLFAVLVPTTVVAVVALLLPLRGIRARIVDAKARELAWCRAAMRTRRARLASGPGDGSSGLDELVAWESRIQAVREWPVDASTFARFVLYLLLPIGSWAGGALVERAIDALLD